MAKVTKTQRRTPGRGRKTIDEALIALFIGAMNANGHEAPDEAARAQHLIWSTQRFRHRPGEEVDRLIGRVRERLRDGNPQAIIDRAAVVIPVALRPAAFAVLVDLLLADGELERQEQAFLRGLASQLALTPKMARQIVDVILLKNRL